MRERTRFEGEVEDLLASVPREAEQTGMQPAWPPKALKSSVIFRHWRSLGYGFNQTGGPVVLTAADCDPGFADNAQTKTCLSLPDAVRHKRLFVSRVFVRLRI